MPRKVLESFNVSYLQVLDANGHLDRDLEPNLSPDALRRLYRSPDPLRSVLSTLAPYRVASV